MSCIEFHVLLFSFWKWKEQKFLSKCKYIFLLWTSCGAYICSYCDIENNSRVCILDMHQNYCKSVCIVAHVKFKTVVIDICNFILTPYIHMQKRKKNSRWNMCHVVYYWLSALRYNVLEYHQILPTDKKDS